MSDGRRRDVLLGRYGSAESKVEYERVLAEWRAPSDSGSSAAGLSVNELLIAYLKHAESYYRDAEGRPTSEITDIRYALRKVRESYGLTPAARFGPLALKSVRNRMIDAGWCRTRINKQVDRVKRCFRWGVSEELVPASIGHGLASVSGLAKGRTPARETDPVRPVPEAHVNAALAHLSAPVAAMVRVQLLTGMRPGEVTIIRGCDLDVTGAVWTYRPAKHKNDWRGRDRVVCIGPRAQAVLRPFLKLDTQAYLFSPADAEAARDRERRRQRATPLYPSHQRRYDRQRAAKERRPLGDRYTTASYGRAIDRACEKAGVPAWAPNRLRHSHATEIRRRFGLEAAGAALGHAKMSATELYAEKDAALAQRIAGEVG
jgi:integrase